MQKDIECQNTTAVKTQNLDSIDLECLLTKQVWTQSKDTVYKQFS